MSKDFFKRSLKTPATFSKARASAVAAGIGTVALTHDKTAEEKGAMRATLESTAIAGASAFLPMPLLAVGAMAYAGMQVGDSVLDAGKKIIEKDRNYQMTGTKSPFSNARFFETKDTFTMRQASMAAIGQARGNLDNLALGNEAQFLR